MIFVNLFTFSKQQKILKSSEFKKVYGKSSKIHSKYFLLLYVPEVEHARLGITVSKKCSKRAVDRNRLKRVVRESFRLHANQLPNADSVIIAKKQAVRVDNTALFSDLDHLWVKLVDCLH